MEAAERIQNAIRLLKPLAEREGLSAKLTLGLFRATHRLEQAVQTPGTDLSEAVRTAIKQLRSCRARIEKSQQPTELGLLESIEQVISLLVPLEGAGPAGDMQSHGRPEPSASPAASTAGNPTAPDAPVSSGPPISFVPATLSLSARSSAAADEVRELRRQMRAARGRALLNVPVAEGTETGEQARSPQPDLGPPATAEPPAPSPAADSAGAVPGSLPNHSRTGGANPVVASPMVAPPPPVVPSAPMSDDAAAARGDWARSSSRPPLPPAGPGPWGVREGPRPAPPGQPPQVQAEPAPRPQIVGDAGPKVRQLLSDLGQAYAQLVGIFQDALSTREQLDLADVRLQRLSLAFRWLDGAGLAFIEEAAASSAEAWDRLIATIALVHAGVAGAGSRLLNSLPGQEQPSLAPVLLSRLADQLDAAGVLSPDVVGGKLRAFIVPILVQKKRLSVAQLELLLRDECDDVAAAAAEALAWIGPRDLAGSLLGRARGANSPVRANAFLFAAVALGCREALVDARSRLEQTGPDPVLLDAIAIAGGEAEGDWLAEVMSNSSARVGETLLAAASLGSRTALHVLPQISDRVAEAVLAEASRRVLGESEPHGAGQPGRRMCGMSWSVSGAIARLGAPEEPISSARRLALEICVRSGKEPPMYVPPHAVASAWPDLAESWNGMFARPDRRLHPGGWYYFGRPCPKAG